MRPIPPAMREELALEPRMKRCVLAGLGLSECYGRIEWDHCFIYAGRQISEKWNLNGVCQSHHRVKDSEWLVRAAIMRSSLRLATPEDLAKYPRKDWAQVRKSLGMEV